MKLAVFVFFFAGVIFHNVAAQKGICPKDYPRFLGSFQAVSLSEDFATLQYTFYCCYYSWTCSISYQILQLNGSYSISYGLSSSGQRTVVTGQAAYNYPVQGQGQVQVSGLSPNQNYVADLLFTTSDGKTITQNTKFATPQAPVVQCDMIAAAAFFGLYRAYEYIETGLSYNFCGNPWTTIAIQSTAVYPDYGIALQNTAAKILVLAFRGTVLEFYPDVITNFSELSGNEINLSNLCCNQSVLQLTYNCSVHNCNEFFPQGCGGGNVMCAYSDDFSRAYDWAFPIVNTAKNNGFERVLVTGHSQGAGIASLVGLKLNQTITGINIQTVYFASPREGNSQLSSTFSSASSAGFFSFNVFSNGGLIFDLVPQGPQFDANGNPLALMPNIQLKDTTGAFTSVTLHHTTVYFTAVYLNSVGRANVNTDLNRSVRYSLNNCIPNCTNKQCGSDGCGGSCGSACSSGSVCVAGKCCTRQCSGKQCGDDGCGSSCGLCPVLTSCTSKGQCPLQGAPAAECQCPEDEICNTAKQCFNPTEVIPEFYGCWNKDPNFGENVGICLEPLGNEDYTIVEINAGKAGQQSTLQKQIVQAMNIQNSLAVLVGDETDTFTFVVFFSSLQDGLSAILAGNFQKMVHDGDFAGTSIAGGTARLVLAESMDYTFDSDTPSPSPQSSSEQSTPSTEQSESSSPNPNSPPQTSETTLSVPSTISFTSTDTESSSGEQPLIPFAFAVTAILLIYFIIMF